MNTPYFITNEYQFKNVLEPLLLEWGYKIHFSSIDWSKCNKLVLNDCGNLGNLWIYQIISTDEDRYLESNIHRFLKKAAELMGEEYKPFIGDKDVIWCPTEELANQVLEIADRIGLKWADGESFKIGSNMWSVCEKETCYFLSNGTYLDRDHFRKKDFNIISAEEFINFYKEYLNMEEKRNIQVTFEQAKEWYRSDNQTLRTLALSAYSKEELEALSFEEIFYKIDTSCPGFYHVPDCENKKWSIINKLAILAQYFNSRSFETTTQYFIKGKFENEIQFGKHVGVRYPGVVYFNNPEDLSKSIKLIGEDINLLF